MKMAVNWNSRYNIYNIIINIIYNIYNNKYQRASGWTLSLANNLIRVSLYLRAECACDANLNNDCELMSLRFQRFCSTVLNDIKIVSIFLVPTSDGPETIQSKTKTRSCRVSGRLETDSATLRHHTDYSSMSSTHCGTGQKVLPHIDHRNINAMDTNWQIHKLIVFKLSILQSVACRRHVDIDNKFTLRKYRELLSNGRHIAMRRTGLVWLSWWTDRWRHHCPLRRDVRWVVWRH